MPPTGIRDSVSDDIFISSPEEVGSDGKHIRGRRVSREQPCNCERSSRSTARTHQGQAAPLGAAFFVAEASRQILLGKTAGPPLQTMGWMAPLGEF